MSDNKRGLATIINALAWAGAILLVAWFTKGAVDKETSFMITMFLLAGWFVTNGLVTTPAASAREEIECVKNLFNKKA